MQEVVQLYNQDLSYEEISKTISGGRLTNLQIRNLLLDSGVSHPANLPRKLNECEDDYIRRAFGRINTGIIGDRLGLSHYVVRQKAFELGLIRKKPRLREGKRQRRKYPSIYRFNTDYLSLDGNRITQGWYRVSVIRNGAVCKLVCCTTGTIFLMSSDIVWFIIQGLKSKIPYSCRVYT